jgi:phosphoribosylanthranilate isomerase
MGESLAGRLRGRVKLAALVVDADDAKLADIARTIKPDFFQLHGRETPARCAEILARFRIPLIKALAVAEPGDLARAAEYDMAEMILLDAPVAESATRPGGHGAAFDWRMLAGSHIAKPWFLAGGLDPENVARAIQVSGAKLVDVSSGVESTVGVKSAALIENFVVAARARVAA